MESPIQIRFIYHIVAKFFDSLFITGIVILILLIVAGIYFFTDIGKNPQALIENKKVDLLERVSETDKTPLTNDEKMSILEKYGGAQTAKYNFTDEEKAKILKALNGR